MFDRSFVSFVGGTISDSSEISSSDSEIKQSLRGKQKAKKLLYIIHSVQQTETLSKLNQELIEKFHQNITRLIFSLSILPVKSSSKAV